MRRDRVGDPLSGRATAGLEIGELRRIWVEAEADLAAALLDERRKPIRERSLAQS